MSCLDGGRSRVLFDRNLIRYPGDNTGSVAHVQNSNLLSDDL